jgi:prevent-host-death family protein
MTIVTANELKTKGIASIEQLLQDAQEVIISVRGKPRYVVMDIAHFDYLRERELEAAWAESRADVAAGRYRRESAEDHLARLSGELNDEL